METYLLIGLGNVGPDFERTRHNVGVRFLRDWVSHMEEKGCTVSPWREDQGLAAEISSVQVSPEKKVWCLFPTTMMNDSGEAVARFLRNHPVEHPHVLIVHDDLETAFGEVWVKMGGSAKGHNGVRSIHEKLASQDVARLLVGIGRPPQAVPAEKFVLQKFTAEEEENLLREIMPRTVAALDQFVTA